MINLKCTIKALMMSKWFLFASWSYIVTNKFSSKIDFFVGFIPAWCRFMIATQKDFVCFYKAEKL